MNEFEVLNGLLVLEHNGKTLQQFFEDQEVDLIAIYGLGIVGARILEIMNIMNINVVAGIDKAADIMSMKGLLLYTPEQIEMIMPKPELIVVTPMSFYYDIQKELILHTSIDIISIGEIIEYCLEGEHLWQLNPMRNNV